MKYLYNMTHNLRLIAYESLRLLRNDFLYISRIYIFRSTPVLQDPGEERRRKEEVYLEGWVGSE